MSPLDGAGRGDDERLAKRDRRLGRRPSAGAHRVSIVFAGGVVEQLNLQPVDHWHSKAAAQETALGQAR